MTDFDAVIVGSGMTGGWAAKELCEAGLKTLLIERGRSITPGKDYPTEFTPPWELELRGLLTREERERFGRKAGDGLVGDLINGFTSHFFVPTEEDPYTTPEDMPFEWTRGYQLGGRSLTWARSVPRWSEDDFRHGGNGMARWPISYADVSPFYSLVEDFIGVSGASDNVPTMPDGKFDPPMPFTPIEEALRRRIEQAFPDRRVIAGRTANLTRERPGRGLCVYRDQCARGCSHGAYFSSISSTLPTATATGNLTILTDTEVEKLLISANGQKIDAVAARHIKSGERSRLTGRLIVLCASTLNSLKVLLRSGEDVDKARLGPPDVLGRYIMDHPKTTAAAALIPGFSELFVKGRRPTSLLIPRYRPLTVDEGPAGSYFHQLIVFRLGWTRAAFQPGVGADLTRSLSRPGDWVAALPTFHECFPYKDNQVSLDYRASNADGSPRLKIEVSYRKNETDLMLESRDQAVSMLRAAGGVVIASSAASAPPGSAVHEMGGARMGNDPATSVLNAWNQLHDFPNVLVTDGACMVTSASQNPSLTYMALTVRACRHAVQQMREGLL